VSGLVLTIRKFNDNLGRVRFDWNLRSNGEIVSTSHRQGYSRRIDCARGAEVGAGLHDLANSRCTYAWRPDYLGGDQVEVEVRLIDERTP
jgi:hypothetical protein